MAKYLLDLLFSLYILFILYYGIKIFFFFIIKHILKLKFMQDRKFRVFGKEL